MFGRSAPRREQSANFGEPDTQIELFRVADRAVDLKRGARRKVSRVAARHLRGGDVPWGTARGGCEKQGAREIEGDVDVSELVFYGLKLTDRTSELDTRLGVAD